MADMVNGFAHIGVPCTDLEKSVSFYEEFGFRAAAKARDLNGYHVAMMENSGCIIELYESADAEEKEAAGQRSDGHVDHIALRTEDLDRVYAYCTEKNYPVVMDGIESTDIWSPKKCRYFTITGPSNERVEFSQTEQ